MKFVGKPFFGNAALKTISAYYETCTINQLLVQLITLYTNHMHVKCTKCVSIEYLSFTGSTPRINGNAHWQPGSCNRGRSIVKMNKDTRKRNQKKIFTPTICSNESCLVFWLYISLLCFSDFYWCVKAW